MAKNQMKRIIKLVAASLVLCSSTIYAASVTDTIQDRYYGKDGSSSSTDDVYGSTGTYQVSSTVVTRETTAGKTFLDVRVNTNFAGRPNSTPYNYGDLLLTDAGTGGRYNPTGGYSETNWFGSNDRGDQTRWKYAFDLNGNRNSTADDATLTSGMQLLELNSSTENGSLSGYRSSFTNGSVRDGQFIRATNTSSNWHDAGNDDSYNAFSINNSENWISFYFDVTGTILASADQIALRWAMSCGNDIIEAVANLAGDPDVQVPEPAAYMLFLAGLFGLGVSRRRKPAKATIA